MQQKTSPKAIDEQWFGALHSIGSETHETYVLLMPPDEVLAQKRQEFERSNYGKNISLEASHIEVERLERYDQRLLGLHRRILAEERNETVQLAYARVLEELITKNNLCIASVEQDYEAFALHNYQAYGGPDKEIFAAAVQWVRDGAMHVGGDAARLASLKEKVLKLLPEFDSQRKLVPDADVFNSVKTLHAEYFDKLFGAVQFKESVVTQATGDDICRSVLHAIGSDYTLADSSDGIWGVIHKTHHVMRPPQYELPKEEFIGIVCHEVGSHLLESVNGSRQKLKLLQTGLDHHEHGNEGRALLREQIVYPHHADFLRKPAWEYAVLKHILIGLAEGLSGHRYTFAQVYEVAYTLFSFWREQRFPGNPDNEVTARDEAWHVTVRVLKGTNGMGGAYTKDVMYLEGNLRCWDVAKTYPELIMYGDQGKFDITNEVHLSLLQELGILPRTFAQRTL